MRIQPASDRQCICHVRERQQGLDAPVPKTEWNVVAKNTQGIDGHFYRSHNYTHPSERALIVESMLWLFFFTPTNGNGVLAGQNIPIDNNRELYPTGAGDSEFDYYRHGKYPRPQSSQKYSTEGGKPATNIAYCDGHVATIYSRDQA